MQGKFQDFFKNSILCTNPVLHMDNRQARGTTKQSPLNPTTSRVSDKAK